jgi:16S rRNA (cytosine1402-N4)-methyltransferase
VFQALRIAVNDELGGLMRGLKAGVALLKPGGRLAVITFHSLEDRAVKRFGRAGSEEYEWNENEMRPDWSRPKEPVLKIVNKKAIRPGATELEENPRSRSAQLRVFEKREGQS